LGQGERSFQGVSNDGGGIAVLISVKTSRFTVHGVSACLPLSAQARSLLLPQTAKTLPKPRDPGIFFWIISDAPCYCGVNLQMLCTPSCLKWEQVLLKITSKYKNSSLLSMELAI